MQYVFARLFFILVPALAFGLAAALFDPILGLAIGCGMAGLGVQVTEPRPERGEGRSLWSH